VTQEANDKQQLVPMRLAVQDNLRQLPARASAATGFFSEANLTAQALAGVDLYVPSEQQRPPAPVEGGPGPASAAGTVREQMHPKLQPPEGQAV
jgi:hypothetical protein